ncbi:PsbP-related protein [Methanobrevibacter oralis]|uniref:PsbP-related protein n=1 Tax=Methanobrevibacter oralis TaxID=66851 RepID=UPI001C7319D5|nr:PsbP-related protein [Methanobrevibacter oralis]
MKSKVFSVSIIIIAIILLLSCIIVNVSADTQDNATKMLTLSKGGIIMNYPSDWGYSQASSNDSVMAISKLDSIDSAGIGQVNINVEKRAISENLSSYLENTYKSMEYDSSFELISSGEVAIGTNTAYEYIYTSTDNGVIREHKAVWFDKNGQACVLLYSAPVDQFEANLYVFDYIVKDIQFA